MRVTILTLLCVFISLPAWATAPNATATASRAADASSDYCYAPCAVQWNASDSNDPDFTTAFENAFNLHYMWDYGDPNSGTWDTTGASRNSEYGFIGGHLYDTPGTYWVTLTVVDESGNYDEWNDTVIVSDPNTLTTYCYCNNTFSCDYTCPGSGTSEPNSSDPNDFTEHMGDSVRILLERGDEWSGYGPDFSSYDHVRFGAYGTGNRPKITTVNGSSGIIMGDDAAVFGIELSGSFTIDCESGGPCGVCGKWDGTFDYWTLYDSRVYGYAKQTYLGESTTWDDHVAVVDNEFGGTNNTAISANDCGYAWIGATRQSFFVGNDAALSYGGDGDENEHWFRLGRSPGTLTAHNRSDCCVSRHHYKYHGHKDYTTDYYRVIRDNWMLNVDEVYPMDIGPQQHTYDPNFDERLDYSLVEDNYLECGPDDVGSDVCTIGILFYNSYSVIRNNICDMTETGSAINVTCILVAQDGYNPDPNQVLVYNNTLYRGGGTGDSLCVDESSNSSNTHSECRNNLVYETSSGTGTATNCTGTGTTSSNNLAVTTNPFAESSFDEKADFQLDSGSSTIIDNGFNYTTLKSVRGVDAWLGLRPGGSGWDIGADEYGAGDPSPAGERFGTIMRGASSITGGTTKK